MKVKDTYDVGVSWQHAERGKVAKWIVAGAVGADAEGREAATISRLTWMMRQDEREDEQPGAVQKSKQVGHQKTLPRCCIQVCGKTGPVVRQQISE